MMTVRAGQNIADGRVSRQLGGRGYLINLRRARLDKRVPHVIALPGPVRLIGQHGPLVVGVASDAPAAVRALWLPSDRCPRTWEVDVLDPGLERANLRALLGLRCLCAAADDLGHRCAASASTKR